MERHKSAGNLGWAAGFIDADGSISIIRTKRKPHDQYRPILQGSNRDLRPLRQLQALFGGTIVQNKYLGAWNNGGRRAPLYAWTCPVASLRMALRLLIPRLVIKREQAELMLDFLQKRRRLKALTAAENDRRHSYHLRMKELNSLERYY